MIIYNNLILINLEKERDETKVKLFENYWLVSLNNIRSMMPTAIIALVIIDRPQVMKSRLLVNEFLSLTYLPS